MQDNGNNFNFSCFLLLASCFLLPASSRASARQQDTIMKGPLQITADETVSKNHGKLVEARGKVYVRYQMESGDLIESFSQTARYDESAGTGELFGNPKAVWKQKDPQQPQATLTADKILLKIKDSELYASGNVVVVQSSYTLKAEDVAFLNQEKKITASGQRPEFVVNDLQQHTTISAEKILAWTEKKQINFSGKVKGVVVLKSDK